MRFKVYHEVFEKLPDLCFGVVVGNQINHQEMEILSGLINFLRFKVNYKMKYLK